MIEDDEVSAVGRKPLRRFWRSALGFWSGLASWIPWALIAVLVVCVVLQLLVQVRLNLWNRDFFNALERRDDAEIWHQTYLLPAFAAMSIGLAMTAVWGRMTFQRRWRDWLTLYLLGLWLNNDNYRRVDVGAREPQLAEYRIAEDARVATDAPIDLVVGLLASLLTAGTFVVVLWTVGGSLDLTRFGIDLELPGYLVFASMAYATLTTGAMIVVGRNMAHVIERKNQAESELKFSVARLRESASAHGNARPRPPDGADRLCLVRGDPAMAAAVRAACAHDPGVPRQHAAGAPHRTDPVRAEIHPWDDAAGRSDAGGGGIRGGPGRVQLAGGQLSAAGRMGVVCKPGGNSAVQARSSRNAH